MSQAPGCLGQGGFTVSYQRVFLVCLLWACGYPSGKRLSRGFSGGFKVLFALQGLWLLTHQRSL